MQAAILHAQGFVIDMIDKYTCIVSAEAKEK